MLQCYMYQILVLGSVRNSSIQYNIKSGYAETPILQQTAGLYAQTIN